MAIFSKNAILLYISIQAVIDKIALFFHKKYSFGVKICLCSDASYTFILSYTKYSFYPKNSYFFRKNLCFYTFLYMIYLPKTLYFYTFLYKV